MARTESTQSRAHSIADLRIYQLALSLEEKVYKLVAGLPPKQFDLGNDLRRASAGVAHHIFDSHRRYSYAVKMEALHQARQEAETAIKRLADFQQAGFGQVGSLCEEYTTLIKQSWGLIKWLKNKQADKAAASSTQAADELVAARS
jgi:four helix bundle protein